MPQMRTVYEEIYQHKHSIFDLCIARECEVDINTCHDCGHPIGWHLGENDRPEWTICFRDESADYELFDDTTEWFCEDCTFSREDLGYDDYEIIV